MTQYDNGIFNMTAEAQAEKEDTASEILQIQDLLNYQESRKAIRSWEKILATNRFSLFDMSKPSKEREKAKDFLSKNTSNKLIISSKHKS